MDHLNAIDILKDQLWALIPARSGSKTIPMKNMVNLEGRPLIDYAVQAALKSELVTRIFCSTDHEKIAMYCLKSGIEVQYRPDSLSGDYVATIDVILYFLEKIVADEGQLPEFLLLLEPTSPFVLLEHISACFNLLKADPLADSSQTVCKVQPNAHAYNQRYHDADGSHFVFPEKRKSCFNKQTKPQFYMHGNIRIMRVTSVMKNRNIFGNRSLTHTISYLYSLDVDGPEELLLASCILQCKLIKVP